MFLCRGCALVAVLVIALVPAKATEEGTSHVGLTKYGGAYNEISEEMTKRALKGKGKKTKSPKTPDSAKSPKSPKTPDSAKSPKSPKTPGSAKSPKNPKSPKSPKSAKSPKTPKSPKSTKAPTAPSLPFGAITEAANCQLYISWARMLKGNSCDATARNSVDCFAGFGDRNNEIVARLCPEVPRRVEGDATACIRFFDPERTQFQNRAEQHCQESLGFDVDQSTGCSKNNPGKKCSCYNACIDYLTADTGFASGGGTCCQNLCEVAATTTTTTPPPTTAR